MIIARAAVAETFYRTRIGAEAERGIQSIGVVAGAETELEIDIQGVEAGAEVVNADIGPGVLVVTEVDRGRGIGGGGQEAVQMKVGRR